LAPVRPWCLEFKYKVRSISFDSPKSLRGKMVGSKTSLQIIDTLELTLSSIHPSSLVYKIYKNVMINIFKFIGTDFWFVPKS
jgi:hypothetical protein